MRKIPVELLFEIFVRTDFLDQKKLRMVNKQYKDIIDSKVFQKNVYHILFKRLSRNIIYKNEIEAMRNVNKKFYITNLLDKDIYKSRPFWKNVKFKKKDEKTFYVENIRGLVKRFVIIGKNIKKVELYFGNTLVWKCYYLSNNIIKIEPFDFGIPSFLSRDIRLLINSENIDKIFSYNFLENYNQTCSHFNSPKEFDIVFFNKNRIYRKILFYKGCASII